MIVVANAGPLIALGQISHFDLLQSLFGELRIPMAVKQEVIGSGRGRAGQQEVSTANWIQVCEVHNTTAVELLQERLDVGESEAIVLAIELHADLLLIDEASGRVSRLGENRHARGFDLGKEAWPHTCRDTIVEQASSCRLSHE